MMNKKPLSCVFILTRRVASVRTRVRVRAKTNLHRNPQVQVASGLFTGREAGTRRGAAGRGAGSRGSPTSDGNCNSRSRAPRMVAKASLTTHGFDDSVSTAEQAASPWTPSLTARRRWATWGHLCAALRRRGGRVRRGGGHV
eukprot:6883391-Prymnesium_polylepis.2